MATSQRFFSGFFQVGLVAVVLGFCIAINVAGGLLVSERALVGAFQSGAIAGRTPPEISDWWHVTRAQADCRSIEPSLGIDGQRLNAAVTRQYLSDHGGKSTDCEILGGFLADQSNTRIGHGMQVSGLSSGGAIATLLIAIAGWKGAQIAHLAAILGAWALTLYLFHRRRLPFWRLAPSTALTFSFLVFAIPGSISLLPVSILLLLLAAGPILQPNPEWWRQHAKNIALVSAVLFCALDPQAGSVVAGLALLLGILPLCLDDRQPAVLLRPALTYVTTTVCAMLVYVFAAILVASPRDLVAFKVFRQTFGDIPQANAWRTEFFGALVNVQDWLVSGIFRSDIAMMIVIWTLPFAMMLGGGAKPDGTESQRGISGPVIMSLLPLAPCLVWIMAYPGLLRRSSDNYALLIAVPLAIALWRMIIAVISAFHGLRKSNPEREIPNSIIMVA